jgi:hypothetical protein
MKNKLKLQIMKHLLSEKKRCPPIMSRGEGNWWDTNCFSVRVNKDGKWYLLLESVTGDIISAKEWDGNRYSTDRQISVDEFKSSDLLITHRYGPFDITYKSYSQYIIGGLTNYQCVKNRVWLFWHNASQFVFNRKRLAHIQRMDLLDSLITYHILTNGNSFNYMDAMEMTYSSKWILHPRADRSKEHMKLLLESFVSSGEITAGGRDYHITGKAIVTLSDYELEKRRHSENVQLRIVMIFLTFAMILVGVLQAIYV